MVLNAISRSLGRRLDSESYTGNREGCKCWRSTVASTQPKINPDRCPKLDAVHSSSRTFTLYKHVLLKSAPIPDIHCYHLDLLDLRLKFDERLWTQPSFQPPHSAILIWRRRFSPGAMILAKSLPHISTEQRQIVPPQRKFRRFLLRTPVLPIARKSE